MEQAVQFGQPAFAVAAEEREADRAQRPAAELSRFEADRRQRELFGRRRPAAGDAEHRRPETIGEFGEALAHGAAAFHDLEELSVACGELDDGSVVLGASDGQGMVRRERDVAGMAQRKQD
jgi:hypothetical protein